jgi:hypothetical protein
MKQILIGQHTHSAIIEFNMQAQIDSEANGFIYARITLAPALLASFQGDVFVL